MKRVADLTYDEERVEDVEPDYRDEMESDGLDAVMNALRQNDVLLDVETPQASSPSVRSVRVCLRMYQSNVAENTNPPLYVTQIREEQSLRIAHFILLEKITGK